MFVILSAESPWNTENSYQTTLEIIAGEYSMESEIWDTISFDAKDLINQMLKINSNERIKINDALNHPWFINNFPERDKSSLYRKTKTDIFGKIEDAFDDADDFNNNNFDGF